MQSWAQRLGAVGEVTTFDYPFMKAGRKYPDRLPALIEAHRLALAGLRSKGPVVLAGKSMGSRIGCHLSLETPVAALICFGYPLRAARTGELRDEVLRALRTPVLFLQGTRDPLCPLADLERVRQQMTAPSRLFVVEGGNHSLEVRKGKEQEEWDRRLLAAAASFIAEHAR